MLNAFNHEKIRIIVKRLYLSLKRQFTILFMSFYFETIQSANCCFSKNQMDPLGSSQSFTTNLICYFKSLKMGQLTSSLGIDRLFTKWQDFGYFLYFCPLLLFVVDLSFLTSTKIKPLLDLVQEGFHCWLILQK